MVHSTSIRTPSNSHPSMTTQVMQLFRVLSHQHTHNAKFATNTSSLSFSEKRASMHACHVSQAMGSYLHVFLMGPVPCRIRVTHMDRHPRNLQGAQTLSLKCWKICSLAAHGFLRERLSLFERAFPSIRQ